MQYLICFDMDRVLVDHMSTWQYVYDQLEISNADAFNLYNQGLLDEWDWLKMDLNLIKTKYPDIDDDSLRARCKGTPLMAGLKECLSWLIENGHEVAIVSGGMQETAREISCMFPSDKPWSKRWGGINPHWGLETVFHVFTNGWLRKSDGGIDDYGRYQVQMNGKGTIVQMLQRRLGIPLERTVSIGDSAGDIGMFEQSGLSICFNPWDEQPVAIAGTTIRDKDLRLVLKCIQDFIKA
ncbi:MAG: HAD-IB family phosphatase [Candidatus Poseidoniaceae archaeon]|nr:HAD-IB family phosphatase [Candidatus Poseidoniaceae archaeon]